MRGGGQASSEFEQGSLDDGCQAVAIIFDKNMNLGRMMKSNFPW